MLQCPKCDKETRSRAGLTKHLMGTREYEGHELDRSIAEGLARNAEAGRAAARVRGERERDDQESSAKRSDAELAQFGAFFEQHLRSLAVNKGLPTYQFERRVEAMFAHVLPALLGEVRGSDALEFVTPELPLFEGRSPTAYVDHLYLDKRSHEWIFVEIKTDPKSVQDMKQRARLLNARPRGFASIYRDIETYASNAGDPATRRKYETLVRRLRAYLPATGAISLVYLVPSRGHFSSEGITVLTYEALARLAHPTQGYVWDLMRSVLIDAIER
jgi:hypothetical protein